MVSPPARSDREAIPGETITLRTPDTGKTIDGVVLSKRADRIHVMLGEGTHSVFCELKPTADGRAYVGSAMGREVVYQHSRIEVEADVGRLAPSLRRSQY